MARRRKRNENVKARALEALFRLGLLLFAIISILIVTSGLGAAFLFGIRGIVRGLGAILFWGSLLGLVATLSVALYRFLYPKAGGPMESLGAAGVKEATHESGTERSQSHLDATPVEIPLSERIRSLDWFQFEKLVEILYRKQGYSVTRRGGANPDGGIDLVLNKDNTETAVQCKHWKAWDVGVAKVREMVGAMADARFSRGIFITTANFTAEAIALAERNCIDLVNHRKLMELLEAADHKYDPDIQKLLRDTNKYCPKCERLMVRKVAESGANQGSEFWGCSGFPICRQTLQV